VLRDPDGELQESRPLRFGNAAGRGTLNPGPDIRTPAWATKISANSV